jgi:hypothetical protein
MTNQTRGRAGRWQLDGRIHRTRPDGAARRNIGAAEPSGCGDFP